MVEKKLSDTNYLIATPQRRKSTQLCHVNLLKPYYLRGQTGKDKGGEIVSVCVAAELDEGVVTPDDSILQGRLKNSESLTRLEELLNHLSEPRRGELSELIRGYPLICGDAPTRTHLIEHDIDVGDVSPIRQRFYRVSVEKRQALDNEIQYMLDNNIAEPSASSWASPCLLVGKPDGTYRFCTDY